MLNKRKIACALAATLSLSVLSSGVLADDFSKTLSAVYSDIKLVINGEETTALDANGNPVDPFIVDGTTYLPVRGVAEALGEDVSWDGETKTVSIGSEITPKYVFLFIGDGLSHVQTQMANYYLDATNTDAVSSLQGGENILKSETRLGYLDFPSVGITTTYDSTSFAPDSASTATSIATGMKTHSGTINMNETLTTAYETIAEQIKAQTDMKIGVVSSVTINHATPAAFYAHNESRNNYYDIGLELVESGFDYFAGGEINKHDNGGESTSIYDLAEDAGYTVVLKDQDAAEAITAEDGKVIIIGEDAQGALPYELDREDGMWALSDYVEKGIEVLDGDDGFFMMVEAGKIDWACHANDAKGSIMDTIAFDNAIAEAYEFYEAHPDETLIIVTGDHETGGMTIGYAGTEYDTFLAQLEGQDGSYDMFEEMVAEYKENKTPFNTVLADIEQFFGLGENGIELTDYEIDKIETAYNVSVKGETIDENEHSAIYGGYEPLAVTPLQILNNKSGIDFTSFSHTGVTVGTYAVGIGSEKFEGFYDNTAIYDSMADLLNVE